VVGVDRRASQRSARGERPSLPLRAWAYRLWFAREGATLAALAVAGHAAFLLRFDGAVPEPWSDRLLSTAVALAVVMYGALAANGVHRRSWRFTSVPDAVVVLRAMVMAAVAVAVLNLMPLRLVRLVRLDVLLGLPTSIVVLAHLLGLVVVLGLRLSRRVAVERPGRRGRGVAPHRAIVIGSGTVAAGLLREVASHHDAPEVVGILTDDRSVHGQLIAGVPVLGRVGELDRVARTVHASMLILALDRPQPDRVRAVVARAQRIGLVVRIRPSQPFARAEVESQRLRAVSLEDLLNRPTAELDSDLIESQVRGRTVLVTGAGGSIGAELARQLLRYRPGTLVLLDRSEVALWAIERELTATAPLGSIVPALVDVADREALERVLAAHPPSVVFHAAALKHVPLLERNVAAAVANNVFGTRALVDASVAAGVTRFVLISSDKAVAPTSVMGATKRLAELVVTDAARRTGRDFVSVRFGNVLGSSGSVVPIFEEQIDRGGPVTITDERMTRFFMTIPEACGLVLQAAVMGGPGAVQVLDMGEPVRIVDLACDLIRLRGLEPGVDIELRTTGMRPGEKLHEELASEIEDLGRSAHPSVLVARTHTPGTAQLYALLDRLDARLADRDETELRRLLFEAVGGAPLSHGAGAPPLGGSRIDDGSRGPLRLVAG
jgi:FlaA1/EpsC-like NDP-sugar epimerase